VGLPFLNNIKSDKFLTEDSGRFLEYLLDRPDVQKAWRAHTEHEFVSGLADGTLPVGAFKNYLIQDYLYLVCRIASTCLPAMVLT
jgi:thiaminase